MFYLRLPPSQGRSLGELQSYYRKQTSLRLPAPGQQPPSRWAARREHTLFKPFHCQRDKAHGFGSK